MSEEFYHNCGGDPQRMDEDDAVRKTDYARLLKAMAKKHNKGCLCEECAAKLSQGLKQFAESQGFVPEKKESNPKDVVGSTKPTFGTVPQTFTALLGLAWLEGGLKYGRHNYRVAGVRASIYYDAAQRHMNKWWEGEWTDPDSGLPHVVKAAACMGVVLDAFINGKLTDDRPPAIPQEFWSDLEQKTKALIAKYPNPVAAFTEVEHGKSSKERDKK